MRTETAPPERRRLIVVAGAFPEHDRHEVRRVAGAVAGADVLVVAPAGPVEGERWIADRDARDRQARERLDRWCAALAPHAARVGGEVGDADARLAVADAQRGAEVREVITAAAPAQPARSGGLVRRERAQPRSARRALRITARSTTSWNRAPLTGGR